MKSKKRSRLHIREGEISPFSTHKGITMSNILVMRLVTGEDMIGDVMLITDSYTVKNPATLMLHPNGQSVAMVPSTMFSNNNETISITKDKILFSYKPSTEILNTYNQKFGSGLIVAGPQLLV